MTAAYVYLWFHFALFSLVTAAWTVKRAWLPAAVSLVQAAAACYAIRAFF